MNSGEPGRRLPTGAARLSEFLAGSVVNANAVGACRGRPLKLRDAPLEFSAVRRGLALCRKQLLDTGCALFAAGLGPLRRLTRQIGCGVPLLHFERRSAGDVLLAAGVDTDEGAHAVGVLVLSAAVVAPAHAATQSLFEATFRIAGAGPGVAATDTFVTTPLVLASRGTLTASITPATFGAAFENLSFNLTSSSTTFLSRSGTGAWTGSVDLEPGTYFALASGRLAPSTGAFSPSGFFGMSIQFAAGDPAVIPIPAAAGLLAGGLGLFGLFARRRRAAAPAITV